MASCGVDHHIIKKGIDGRTQYGQRLQAGGVVARLKLGLGFGHKALQGSKQVLFGLLLQQCWVDVGIDLTGLFQDVAHALVGGSQSRSFGQGGKGTHGL